MSYEFFAPLPEGVIPSVSELLQTLLRQLPLALVSTSKDKILLRWADLPLRTDWPEDIEISCNANGMLVSFHVGLAEQRRMVLSILANELTKMVGMLVEFDEL